MFVAAAIAIAITMALAVCRALVGPTVYDRILSLNMFGTKTVLFMAVIAFLGGRPEFIDLALIYAMINFIGTIAVLQFFQSREILKAEEGKSRGDRT